MSATPRIIVSVARSTVYRLRMLRFTFGRLVRRAGGDPVIVEHRRSISDETWQTEAVRLVEDASGLLLGGGGDVDRRLYGDQSPDLASSTARDRFELTLIAAARRRGLPVFGICRGCQLLNVGFGGTLRNLREDESLRRYHSRFRKHDVHLEPSSRLAGMLDSELLRGVRSIHGQAVDQPGRGLRIVATASDGVAEAIEAIGGPGPVGPWAVGVQWHPELMLRRRPEHRLLDAFIEAARS
jgi:putative glutamine amidotransferase